ncbi:MAG TPA: histidine ammonia-lyase, partial [Bacilli bacterium]
MAVEISGHDLDLEKFIRIVRYKEEAYLTDDAEARITQARHAIENIMHENRKVYGLNTGFGKLSEVVISASDLSDLQINLLKSHACGVGAHLSEEEVRGIMLLRINALAKGYSGIKLETVKQLLLYLNLNILPTIPEQGSLGASGDLAPLAHMALSLLGEGEVYYQGRLLPVKEALNLAGIKPLPRLEAKEGLSLINGTQAMTAIGALALYDALRLAKIADIAGALSLEALLGVRDAFVPEIHQARGQLGQIVSAGNIRKLTKESELLTSQGEVRVQDAYSLRCLSQVHGASRDALKYIKEKVEIEMNAATDNPLIFNEETVISGGNFHGEVMAQAFDFLKIAVSELANISERRIERLVNPTLNAGLPPFLVAKPGLDSGFMIVQYSAASLVSENKVLAHPASVDSIPSSGNQEDHVSMGTIAARQAREIVKNCGKVLGMELFTACQALDFRKKALGVGTDAAYRYFRSLIPFLEKDEIMYPYLEKAEKIINDSKFLAAVEEKV